MAVLLTACSGPPEPDTPLNAVMAFNHYCNKYDVVQAYPLLAKGAVRNDSGFGWDALSAMLKWHKRYNNSVALTSFRTNKDTVWCSGTQTSGFLRMIGIQEKRYPRIRFITQDNRIAQIDMRPHWYDERLERVALNRTARHLVRMGVYARFDEALEKMLDPDESMNPFDTEAGRNVADGFLAEKAAALVGLKEYSALLDSSRWQCDTVPVPDAVRILAALDTDASYDDILGALREYPVIHTAPHRRAITQCGKVAGLAYESRRHAVIHAPRDSLFIRVSEMRYRSSEPDITLIIVLKNRPDTDNTLAFLRGAFPGMGGESSGAWLSGDRCKSPEHGIPQYFVLNKDISTTVDFGRFVDAKSPVLIRNFTGHDFSW